MTTEQDVMRLLRERAELKAELEEQYVLQEVNLRLWKGAEKERNALKAETVSLRESIKTEHEYLLKQRDALQAALMRLRDEPVAGATYRSSWDDKVYDATDIARQALEEAEE